MSFEASCLHNTVIANLAGFSSLFDAMIYNANAETSSVDITLLLRLNVKKVEGTRQPVLS